MGGRNRAVISNDNEKRLHPPFVMRKSETDLTAIKRPYIYIYKDSDGRPTARINHDNRTINIGPTGRLRSKVHHLAISARVATPSDAQLTIAPAICNRGSLSRPKPRIMARPSPFLPISSTSTTHHTLVFDRLTRSRFTFITCNP